jgi:predicted Rossmann fold flavoprotein
LEQSIGWEVIVVGGGAAGLLAAARAAERGRRTLLLEKNRQPGVKILMSGGTRCNLTHDTDARGIIEAFGGQGKFLHSALAALGPRALVELIEAEGVPTKIEPTGKIFPVSNKAGDVLKGLLRRLDRSRAVLALEEPVRDLERLPGGFRVITSRRTLETAKVIVTSGGKSYPGSGTSGDGYAWATKLGHTLVLPRPALTPVTIDAPWTSALKGVTLPDVRVTVAQDFDTTAGASTMPGAPRRALVERRGSLLFTHFGLSGPVVLDVSGTVSRHDRPETLLLQVDFLPEMPPQDLDEWLRQESVAAGKKQLAAVLAQRLPRRLADALLEQAGLRADRRAAALSKVERAGLVRAINRQTLPVTGTMGFMKAEVTAGGVSLAEVDSRTMESKLAPNLYWAGEVLDLDGPIGGYNFQAAFSTGWRAGESV